MKIADDLPEIGRQPWLLLLLCEAEQGREVRDVVEGQRVLWSTRWHRQAGHRLEQRCESSGTPPLLADGAEKVLPYDLVICTRT